MVHIMSLMKLICFMTEQMLILLNTVKLYSTHLVCGLGTYIPRIVGNNVMIDYKLNSPINADLEINAIAVSIASTQSVGVGTDVLTTAVSQIWICFYCIFIFSS